MCAMIDDYNRLVNWTEATCGVIDTSLVHADRECAVHTEFIMHIGNPEKTHLTVNKLRASIITQIHEKTFFKLDIL